MNDLLFYLTILALLYYFFYYLPSQKKLNANLPLQQHQELEELKANLKEAIVEWEKQEKAVENLGQLKNGFERNVFDFLDIYETE
jgi:flagellar motility protein MotE (MotC chaperone)